MRTRQSQRHIGAMLGEMLVENPELSSVPTDEEDDLLEVNSDFEFDDTF